MGPYTQVPITVPSGTSNPGWRENRSVCSFYLFLALVSGSFWGGGVPHFLCQWGGAFWNVLESQGRLRLLWGGRMKRCTHTSDDKRGLGKWGHRLGVSWGPRWPAGLSIGWDWDRWS